MKAEKMMNEKVEVLPNRPSVSVEGAAADHKANMHVNASGVSRIDTPTGAGVYFKTKFAMFVAQPAIG